MIPRQAAVVQPQPKALPQESVAAAMQRPLVHNQAAPSPGSSHPAPTSGPVHQYQPQHGRQGQGHVVESHSKHRSNGE